jgi:hypothetical protein
MSNKFPAKHTYLACGVTMAVATGTIAGVLFATAMDAAEAGNDAVLLAGTQRVNTAEKADRLALPDPSLAIARDERSEPLAALVRANVITAPETSAVETQPAAAPAAPAAPSAAEPVAEVIAAVEAPAPAPAPAVEAPAERPSFAALTFEPVQAGDHDRNAPLSILPSHTRNAAAQQPTVAPGDAAPATGTLSFAAIPAPTTIVPSSAPQDDGNEFQMPAGSQQTKPLDYWDIR